MLRSLDLLHAVNVRLWLKAGIGVRPGLFSGSTPVESVREEMVAPM
jgi:hypothetical protein